MKINIPEIVAEVTAAFERYERALVANDLGVMDELFWASPLTIRYGLAENQHGIEAIRAYRAAAPGVARDRELFDTVVTSFGRDSATVSTQFRNESSGRRGRQMQTWIRMPEGWRIVAAHVSLLSPAAR